MANVNANLGGWLLKQGPKGPKLYVFFISLITYWITAIIDFMNSWKSRYFELFNDSELHYGSSDQSLNPQTSLGYIDLRRATSAENDDK